MTNKIRVVSDDIWAALGPIIKILDEIHPAKQQFAIEFLLARHAYNLDDPRVGEITMNRMNKQAKVLMRQMLLVSASVETARQ